MGNFHQQLALLRQKVARIDRKYAVAEKPRVAPCLIEVVLGVDSQSLLVRGGGACRNEPSLLVSDVRQGNDRPLRLGIGADVPQVRL